MNLSHADKLKVLRANLQKHGLDGFIVPRTDRFQGENPAPCDERLEWLSGFSGSAGVAIVLQDKAIVMTDGRYTIQVKQQVDPVVFETGDSTKVKTGEWLAAHINGEAVIGYDPWLHTPKQIEAIEKILKDTAITLRAVENPIDAIWLHRPKEPVGIAEVFPLETAGKSHTEKTTEVAERISGAGASAAIIALPDSICWLLNVRGADVDYAPLVLSYAIVHAKEERIDWIVNPAKITPEMKRHLGEHVRICDFAKLESFIKDLKEHVLLDFDRAPVWFKNTLEAQGTKIIDAKDPCVDLKALKNDSEQAGIENAHIRDGAAMVTFLHWLEKNAVGQSELSIGDKLEEIRAAHKLYRGPSFATIAGFGPNGAIIHYRASDKTSRKITQGILLLDSGAQYTDGTTDITRTIAIGAPSEEQKRNFTLVLKGHINLARAQFAAGTTGAELDVFARQALKDAGLDYAHGTGHGVGCYLQVHEEAASISPRGKDALQEGMLISNEPGYYLEGAYGIRIESLVLVVATEDKLAFKTMTLCPIDQNLIATGMLTHEERNWLDAYHARVYETLAPLLSKDDANWLRGKTQKLRT